MLCTNCYLASTMKAKRIESTTQKKSSKQGTASSYLHCRRIGFVYNAVDFIEASAGIYKSTRLGGQGSPGYIWQFTIRISTTTKYTLILWNNHDHTI